MKQVVISFDPKVDTDEFLKLIDLLRGSLSMSYRIVEGDEDEE